MSQYYRVHEGKPLPLGEFKVFPVCTQLVPVEVDDIPEVKNLRKTVESFSRTEHPATIEEIEAAGFDPWHLASDPPKPEDFHPTGNVQVWDGYSAFTLPMAWTFEKERWTHWRKISPPSHGG